MIYLSMRKTRLLRRDRAKNVRYLLEIDFLYYFCKISYIYFYNNIFVLI